MGRGKIVLLNTRLSYLTEDGAVLMSRWVGAWLDYKDVKNGSIGFREGSGDSGLHPDEIHWLPEPSGASLSPKRGSLR